MTTLFGLCFLLVSSGVWSLWTRKSFGILLRLLVRVADVGPATLWWAFVERWNLALCIRLSVSLSNLFSNVL